MGDKLIDPLDSVTRVHFLYILYISDYEMLGCNIGFYIVHAAWARQNIGTTQGGKTLMEHIYFLRQYMLRNM